jgi:hypothetical protein
MHALHLALQWPLAPLPINPRHLPACWVQVAWLTPVEIFHPHVGNALARFIAGQHDERQQRQRQQGTRAGSAPHSAVAGAAGAAGTVSGRDGAVGAVWDRLRIVEIGGGTGTLARGILVSGEHSTARAELARGCGAHTHPHGRFWQRLLCAMHQPAVHSLAAVAVCHAPASRAQDGHTLQTPPSAPSSVPHSQTTSACNQTCRIT